MADVSLGDELAAALVAAGAEIVRQNEDEQSIRLLCRVKYKRVWLDILEYVLARKQNWEVHVCQQYFMRGGKLVFGWNFIFDPIDCDLSSAVDKAVSLLTQAVRVISQMEGDDPAQMEGAIESFPLIGASSRRNAPIIKDPKTGIPIHRGGYPMGTGG